MENEQIKLSDDQISNFYHDSFVTNQVDDFLILSNSYINQSIGKVVDIGGGYGFFAQELRIRKNINVRVIDSDIKSINTCQEKGIEAIYGDALHPIIIGDETIICFNLILHHLIGSSEYETHKMQTRALSIWQSSVHAIFVNEYIYESYIINNISGWLIYKITSNSILSRLGRYIAKFIPSLKANTFGVGVRFRSHEEWRKIFSSIGFEVIDTIYGKDEYISLPRRFLLIKKCRRDSFILKPIIQNN